MPRLTLTEENGGSQVLQVSAGQTISEALRGNGFALDQPCGGRGVCGKCKVCARGALSPVCGEERRRLTEGDLSEGYRLGCMARIMGDAGVVLPPAQGALHIMTDAAATCPPAADPLYRRCGAAVDIGTTTLCVQVYGPGGLLSTAACKNPQAAFGADVISRISHALNEGGGALQSTVASAIDGLLLQAAQSAAIAAGDIDALVITGNTAMLYLLAHANPVSLSRAPFEADRLFGETLWGRELGLSAVPSARCYLPPCIGAYLGADITTAILYSDMRGQAGASLLVDAGTNGEIALWKGGRLHCCSTAAGPAFEGGGIERGMLGMRGAIDAVWMEEGALRCSTIGHAAPIGICGSGIIDAVAVLLQAEALDETGALMRDEPHILAERIETRGNMPIVRLQEEVYLSQADIRAVQLAKAAIHAGIQTLLHTAGQAENALAHAMLAGGFGTYLRMESAVRIGLIPPAFLKNGSALGNAALGGAAMLLQDGRLIRQVREIAATAEIVELAGNPSFMEYYVESMLF